MIRSPHSPADSPHDGAFGRLFGPGAPRDGPSNWQSLWQLRQTLAACVSALLGRYPPDPDRAGSSSLRPTRWRAPMSHSELGPPDGGTAYSGSNRALDGPGETELAHVSISTRPHHRRHTGAPALPESRRPL